MPNVKSRTTSPPASANASVNAAVVFVKYGSSGDENVTAVGRPAVGGELGGRGGLDRVAEAHQERAAGRGRRGRGRWTRWR